MTDADSRYEQAATRLRLAAADGTPCPPIRDLLGPSDIAGAYAVQRMNVEAAISNGRRRAGRKIGLTSQAVQEQFGVGEPDHGVLFDDVVFESGATLPYGSVLQPKGEAEIAVRLEHDLTGAGVTVQQVRAAIGSVAPAIEVADSRIASWDITVVDTIADNASAGLAVIGSWSPLPDELDLASATMAMWRNGALESTGAGSASLEDPLNALAWLAHAADELGEPLRAGEVVLTGALGPVLNLVAGDEIVVEISGIGRVWAGFDA